MAWDPQPSSLFASWSEDGTDITVPIASIDNLTAVEADGATGDWRAVIGRILDHTYEYREGLPSADQPGSLTITRSRRESGDSIVRQYIVQWYTDEDSISTTAE